MELDNRFDLYFSYWLLFWALYSIISKETVFPLMSMSIAFILQYMYIYVCINKIIDSKILYKSFFNINDNKKGITYKVFVIIKMLDCLNFFSK